MYEIIGALGPYAPDYVQATQSFVASTGAAEKLSSTKDALKEDLKDADFKDRVKASLAIVAAAWEWGPLNEITAAIPSVAVLEATGNPIMAGAVGGAIYAAQQIGFGLATAAAIDAIPKTEHTIREEFNTAETGGASKSDRALLLLGMGASAVVINEHIRDKEQTFKKDSILLGKLAVLLCAVDVAVFSAANGVIDNADKVNVDPSTVIDIATNPWTYVGIFALAKSIGYYKKIKKSKPVEISTINNAELK